MHKQLSVYLKKYEMIDNSDIRFKILAHLNKFGQSTEEINCNAFLETLHSDLGTIRRTLIELIEKGYINESNVNWERERETLSAIYKINTRGDHTRKDSKRLLKPNDIEAIRLYLTLDGKKFLIESENLKHYSWTIRNDWWMKIIYIIIGAVLTLGAYIIRDNQTKKEKIILESNTQKSIDTFGNKNKLNLSSQSDTIQTIKSK